MEATMGVTFPNESPGYRVARDKLLQREVAFALKGVTEPEEVFAPAAPDDGPEDL
jgi:hypothetical protein